MLTNSDKWNPFVSNICANYEASMKSKDKTKFLGKSVPIRFGIEGASPTNAIFSVITKLGYYSNWNSKSHSEKFVTNHGLNLWPFWHVTHPNERENDDERLGKNGNFYFWNKNDTRMQFWFFNLNSISFPVFSFHRLEGFRIR